MISLEICACGGPKAINFKSFFIHILYYLYQVGTRGKGPPTPKPSDILKVSWLWPKKPLCGYLNWTLLSEESSIYSLAHSQALYTHLEYITPINVAPPK